MKQILSTLVLGIFLFVTTVTQTGCQNMTPAQQTTASAVLTDAITIATIAATVASDIYGMPIAGQAASQLLAEIDTVLQANIGKQITPATILASVSTGASNTALTAILNALFTSNNTTGKPLISTSNVITSQDISLFQTAVAVASVMTPASIQKHSEQLKRRAALYRFHSIS